MKPARIRATLRAMRSRWEADAARFQQMFPGRDLQTEQSAIAETIRDIESACANISCIPGMTDDALTKEWERGR